MRQWYAVFTRPRQESVAQENLERQGYEVYCPRIQMDRRHRCGWRPVVEPLFPRYLFLRVDASTCSLYSVRSTRGVSDLVRFLDKLVPVPDPAIRYLKHTADSDTGLHRLERTLFDTGCRVRLLTGPLAGMEAVFQTERGKDRVLVLMELLGRPSTVWVSRDQLVPA